MRALHLALLLSIASACAVAACSQGSNTPAVDAGVRAGDASARPETLAAQAVEGGAPTTLSCSTGVLPPVTLSFGPTVPPDISSFANQSAADCFAWWEFVALNWPAGAADGGAAGFGDPMDMGPGAWETYISSNLLFQADGGAPPPWGTEPAVPSDCLSQAGLTGAPAKTRVLAATSKFETPFGPLDTAEAFPPPNWLGAQNGTNVWYEVRANQDEYNYMVGTGLYNAVNQSAWVADGGPIVLPKGCAPTAGETCDGGVPATGAIELKAAWMEAPDTNDPSQRAKWSRYKLTQAVVVDPGTQKCRATTLALVGLHILHKTTHQPSWVWATFEHVDNAPYGDGGAPPPYGYNFNNPSCAPIKVSAPASCVPDAGQDGSVEVTVGCTPNQPPPYNLGPGCPGPKPTQVTRLNQIDPNYAAPINAKVQAWIQQNYPSSVWQYYQLVDVLWSTNPRPDPTTPVKAPQPPSSMISGNNPHIANTTMETYIQNQNCVYCHQNATIAQGTWFSDFSFLFGNAGPAQANAVALRAAAKLKAKAKAK